MDLPTPSACSSCSAAHAEPVVRVEPTTMTIEHWGRLREGQLFATSRDIAWAVRMQRTFRLEVFDGAKRAGAEVMAMATDLPSAPLAPAPLP